MLGTVWTGGDVSLRYERAKLTAQRRLNGDGSKSTITHSEPSESHRQHDDEDINAEVTCILPDVPAGKATQQAAESRAQVLHDSPSAGGWSVLADEVEEERLAAQVDANLRRSPRKTAKSSSSAPSQAGSLKGLKERVSGSFQGRRGTGVLGMESSR